MLAQIVYSSYYRGLSYIDFTKKKFLFLNGQTVLRADYPELSSYFPTGTYGSTATTIVLPDVTGTYWRGLDLGRGADVERSSRITPSGTDPTGDNLGAYQTGNLASHTHNPGSIPPGGTSHSTGPSSVINFSTTTNYTTQGPVVVNPSGVAVSGTTAGSFDVGSVTYFAYLGAD